MCEFVYTTYPDKNAAMEDLKKKISYEPDLAVLFVTKGLMRDHLEFSKLFNSKVVCVPIEGYVTRDGIWTRGVLAWLIDSRVDVEVYKGSANKVCKELSRSHSGKFSLLIYPSFYFGSRLSLFLAFLKERRFYGQYKRGDKNALKRASEFLKEKFVYPINDILRPFRDRGEPAVSLNLMPLEAGFNTPTISLNGKDIGRALLRLKFNKKIKLDYEDTFPERGNNLEETIEILKSEFGYAKVVTVEKSGVALGHVNGTPAVEFAVKETGIVTEDPFSKMRNGRLLSSTPYLLWFISSETSGFTSIGILPYPLNIYPTLFTLDVFYDVCLFAGETTKDLLNKLSEFFASSENEEIYFIDQNYILIFEEHLVKLIDKFRPGSFGIFTYSSVTANFRRRFGTEIEERICTNLTRNITVVKSM